MKSFELILIFALNLFIEWGGTDKVPYLIVTLDKIM